MKFLVKNVVMGAGMLALLAAGGCSKKSASAPLAIEKVPQVLESAFKNARPEATQAVSEVVTAVRNDDPGALTDLQELSARPDLNNDQRVAASRAMSAYLQKLRAAAEKGDKKSEEALEHYRATK